MLETIRMKMKQNGCVSVFLPRLSVENASFSIKLVFSALCLHVLYIISSNKRSESVAPRFIFSFNQLIAQQHAEPFPEREQKEIA